MLSGGDKFVTGGLGIYQGVGSFAVDCLGYEQGCSEGINSFVVGWLSCCRQADNRFVVGVLDICLGTNGFVIGSVHT
jgi:hypothetical protein